MPALQVDGHTVIGARQQLELLAALARLAAREVAVDDDEQAMSRTVLTSSSGQICCSVQKNGTPRR